MPQPVVFISYPSQPQQVGAAIEAAAQHCNRGNLPFHTESWRQIDIPGHFIIDGILDRIQVAHFVVADITRLNFNVTFEVGYALGRGKRVLLVLNRATEPETKEITQLGIFDTLGYAPYSNGPELFSIVKNVVDTSPPRFAAVDIDRSAPIYVLDTFHKTDAALRIISRIKKSRLHFRSFDPKEQPRLATSEAVRNVRASIAVIANLLSYNSTDHKFNNLRGAFLAGLAMGADKETLLLQEGEEPVPVDYRDLVRVYRHPDDIDPLIAELVPKVTKRLQEVTFELSSSLPQLLERINLGAAAAENEASMLGAYYVATDEYNKALSGMIRLAVGRKGSGKTALFFRLRDRVRNDRQNVVLDLKPDGYQLKRFKFMVLDVLQEAVKEHVATAFWMFMNTSSIAHLIAASTEKFRWTGLIQISCESFCAAELFTV